MLGLTRLAVGAEVPPPGSTQALPGAQVQWKKTVIDTKFRSEGVAVADVNHDGKTDVLTGDVWYEAPAWKMHEIRKPTELSDGAHTWSKSFLCFTDDFNRDGWADLLVIGFPGEAAFWYENPQNQSGHWKRRLVATSACNETPVYEDLFGDGRKHLVMATQDEGRMWWFSVPHDLDKPWDRHTVSEASTKDKRVWGTDKFSHGLGVGDINGDGRRDVLVRQGWWEQPPTARTSNAPWKFHAANLSDDCANIHTVDVDGDGLNDVLSSSAHRKGIWWSRQTPGKGASEFRPTVILNDFSQSHALNYVDINGDGTKDLVTGKRWWAHGPEGDVEPNAPAVLYWIEIRLQPGAPARFIAHPVDDNSGIGTQFTVADFNGDQRPDIIVANKKGTHIFEQVRERK